MASTSSPITPQRIVCTAPGKLILFGEHAVVYGKKAVATALSDLRTKVILSVDETHPGHVDFYAPSVGIDHEAKVDMEEVKSVVKDYSIPSMMMDTSGGNGMESMYGEAFKPNREVVEALLKLARKVYYPKEDVRRDGNGTPSESDPKVISVVAVLYLILLLDPELKIGIRVELSNNNLPIGAGLGSSASFSVCLVAAVLMLLRPNLMNHQLINTEDETTLEHINRWAYFVESLIHGTPSGIDNSVGTYGGVLSFAKGQVMEHLSPTILPTMRILIVNTRVERNTKLIVQRVREAREVDFESVESRLNEIQEISDAYLKLLRENYEKHSMEKTVPFTSELRRDMERFIDRNHILLNEIGTGHLKLDIICDIAAKYGLHAKLTGAGGGGCAFVLLEDEESEKEALLKKDLEKEGFEHFMSNSVAGSGVRCEECK